MENSGTEISRSMLFWVWVSFVFFVYFGLLYYFDRTLFSPRPGRVVESMDGFQFSLIAYEAGGVNELWLTMRYYIVWPILEMDRTGYGPFYQGCYLLLYSLPIALWRQKFGQYRYAQVLLMLIPIFINFRLAICIYATAYLCIFAIDSAARKSLLLWFSISLVLSSSTMFVFLLYLPLLGWSKLKGVGYFFRTLFFILYFVITSEFLGKILALFDRSVSGEVLSTAADAGLGYAGSFDGFILALISGNPFFTAIIYGQYDRLFILIPSAIFGVFFVTYLYRIKSYRALVFVLILMSSMLSEGVGSYSLPVIIFLMIIRSREMLFQVPINSVSTLENAVQRDLSHLRLGTHRSYYAS
jgi:hypothetical protein